ncbi:tRNA nucleotidyltransferase [Rhodothermaceae bacterium RA]|nr:tRNA nucleotidyltransferase [Rhodothermaceae bacterium RA]
MNLTDRLEGRSFTPVLRQVGEVAADEGIEAYAVGGLVRDVLLDRPTTDLDFVTVGPGTGIRLAEAVAARLGGQTVHTYPNFGTAAIRLHGSGDEVLVLEFVAARRESYRRHSRKPLVEDGTLEDDQRRRDFTINAMGLHLVPARFGELIDPFDGLRDLHDRLLRTPLDPHQTFEDDPLRMIRAARFAAQLDFRIHEAAFQAMRDRAARVRILSQERVTDELQKILCAGRPSVGFKILEATGILVHLFPELVDLKGVEEVHGHRHKDNFYHTLQVVDNVAALTADRPCEQTRWLRWAALLHDIAKPLTKRFVPGTGWTFHGHEDRGARMIPKLFRRLKLPTDERMRYVQKLVQLHHRPVALVDEEVTDSAVRRLLFDAGEDLDDLMTLVRADITSKNPRRVRRYLAAFDRVEQKFAEVEEKDRLRNFQPPVDGYEIMEVLGIREGLAVGLIKETIREAILEGEIPNEHDAAYALMMRIKDEALRRGRLFEEMMRRLEGRERAAMGAIKDALFHDDIPADPDAAIAYLMQVKEDALAEPVR